MLSRTMSTGIPSIRNLQYPVCKNCVFFIEGFSEPRSGIEKPRSSIDATQRSWVKSTEDENTNNYLYDSVPDNAYYGKCVKFGKMNLVTGCIEYDFAKLCRVDEKKCGWWGDGYQEKVKTT